MPEMATSVDRHGAVLGPVPRVEVRRHTLLHAATAVLVRDPRDRIYVHRRSAAKDWAPSHHDAVAGGVLTYGEEPLAGATRELAEELGVVGATLGPLTEHLVEDATVRCFLHCFTAVWDGPVVHADGEVVWGAWWTLEELGAHLAEPGWPFVPDTRSLLARLAADGVADYGRLIGGPGSAAAARRR